MTNNENDFADDDVGEVNRNPTIMQVDNNNVHNYPEVEEAVVGEDEMENEQENNNADGNDGEREVPNVGRGRGRGRGRGQQGSRAANGQLSQQRKWDKSEQPQGNPNESVAFSEVCGPTRLVRLLSQPINFFMLFITESIVKTLVEQTNLYCKQSNHGNSPADWQDVCYEDILAFIFVVIAMGLVQLP